MKAVAIIPARGGSRRIERKNIRPFLGVPMLQRAIKTAWDSNLFLDVLVSTEDEEIKRLSWQWGARVIERPPELAEVNAPDCGTQEVVRHALKALNRSDIDYACCIYPCTPLLEPMDLVKSFAMLFRSRSAYCYAVDEKWRDAGQFYWGQQWAFTSRLPLDSGREVMAVDTWFLSNGTNSGIYKIPERGIDINTESDWRNAEALYKQLHKDEA